MMSHNTACGGQLWIWGFEQSSPWIHQVGGTSEGEAATVFVVFRV